MLMYVGRNRSNVFEHPVFLHDKALASFPHLTFDIWRFTTICGLGLASTGAVKTGLGDQ